MTPRVLFLNEYDSEHDNDKDNCGKDDCTGDVACDICEQYGNAKGPKI